MKSKKYIYKYTNINYYIFINKDYKIINNNKIASRNSLGFRMTLLPFDADGSQQTSSDDAIKTFFLSARPVTRKEVTGYPAQLPDRRA